MSTIIRSKLSLRNPHYISKERYLELKHFCLQYPEWNKELSNLRLIRSGSPTDTIKTDDIKDPTGDIAVKVARLTKRIDVLKEAITGLDPWISDYIFEAVTSGRTYEYYQTNGIACGRVYFYQRYHEFFYLLDKVRE